MIEQAIQDKLMQLARAEETAKNNTSAKQRITYLLNVITLRSQLIYLLEIQSASNAK